MEVKQTTDNETQAHLGKFTANLRWPISQLKVNNKEYWQ